MWLEGSLFNWWTVVWFIIKQICTMPLGKNNSSGFGLERFRMTWMVVKTSNYQNTNREDRVDR